MFFTKKKATDLVCGMEIKVDSSTLRSNYQGKEYYFCSGACLKKFESDPQNYVAAPNEGNHGGGHSGHSHHGH